MWYPVITAGAEDVSPPKEFIVQSASACSVMFKVPQAT